MNPTPTISFMFFLWCLCANVLVLSWAYNTQQVFLMEKQVFHPTQKKSWTLRCPNDKQKKPLTWTTVPNNKGFCSSTSSPYFFPRFFHDEGLPAYMWISSWFGQSRRNVIRQASAMPSKMGTSTRTWQFTSSQRVVGSIVEWASSQHHAKQLKVVINSANPTCSFFSFFLLLSYMDSCPLHFALSFRYEWIKNL